MSMFYYILHNSTSYYNRNFNDVFFSRNYDFVFTNLCRNEAEWSFKIHLSALADKTEYENVEKFNLESPMTLQPL